jgi:hypothetical protein
MGLVGYGQPQAVRLRMRSLFFAALDFFLLFFFILGAISLLFIYSKNFEKNKCKLSNYLLAIAGKKTKLMIQKYSLVFFCFFCCVIFPAIVNSNPTIEPSIA